MGEQEGPTMEDIGVEATEERNESRLETETEEYPETAEHKNGIVFTERVRDLKTGKKFSIKDSKRGKLFSEKRVCYEGEQVLKKEIMKDGQMKEYENIEEKKMRIEKGRDLHRDNAWRSETTYKEDGWEKERLTKTTSGPNTGRESLTTFSYEQGGTITIKGKDYKGLVCTESTEILRQGPSLDDEGKTYLKVVVYDENGDYIIHRHGKETPSATTPAPDSGRP